MDARLVTTAEAGAHIGVTDSRIRQLLLAGIIPERRRIGGAILVSLDDVEAYARSKRPVGRPPRPASPPA